MFDSVDTDYLEDAVAGIFHRHIANEAKGLDVSLLAVDFKELEFTHAQTDYIQLVGITTDSLDISAISLKNSFIHNTVIGCLTAEKTSFKDANFYKSRMDNANLEGADLSGLVAELSFMIGADLKGANLTGANLNMLDLRCANLTGANLTDMIINNSVLYGAILKEVDLRGIDMQGCMFSDGFGPSAIISNLEGADFTGAMLCETDFAFVEATGAIYTDATIGEGDFTRANLTGADFTRAFANGACFADANMANACFKSAGLVNAYLSGANCVGSDFTDADLSGACLVDTDFTGANLAGANLTDADITGAIFTDTNINVDTLT